MKQGRIAVVSTILGAIAGGVTSGIAVGCYQEKEISLKQKKVDKFKSYYNMLNQWLIIKQEGKNLESYFMVNKYNTIAIYGMGEMGDRLYNELRNTSVKIKYGIDKEVASTCSEIEIFEIDEHLAEVDVVIVTSIFAFNEIEEVLAQKLSCDIVSLEEVLYEI